jgi:hypothetical protein
MQADEAGDTLEPGRRAEPAEREVIYVAVGELRPEGDVDTCLRPLGLCELGGSCDSCWYRPDHPRFRRE